MIQRNNDKSNVGGYAPKVELLESELNDNHSSTCFVDENISELRYCYTWKKWLAWDGMRWSLGSGDNRAGDRARLFATGLFDMARRAFEISHPQAEQIAKYATQANRKERISAVTELAKYDQRIAISHDQLDDDPQILNLQNGTLDLRSCKMHTHQQSDLLTQVANVRFDAAADCPLWRQTMDLIFDGDSDLIRYVQALVGYSLSGLIGEHIIPICCGDGRNGKSTFWNTIHDILGDYSGIVSQELILPSQQKDHPTELADLFGKRFVSVAEPDEGRKLAESRVKAMAGDAIMKARRMREDFWEFTPTHTLWLATNHKPRVTGTDTGIWRRIKLIPFAVDIADKVEVDKNFLVKLKAEHSGILNWCLDGWRDYQQNGLIEPAAVTSATSEYRNAEDTLGEFIRETYILNDEFILEAREAFKAFQEWGGKLSKTAFGSEMSKRFEKSRHTAGKYRNKTVYSGLGLLE